MSASPEILPNDPIVPNVRMALSSQISLCRIRDACDLAISLTARPVVRAPQRRDNSSFRHPVFPTWKRVGRVMGVTQPRLDRRSTVVGEAPGSAPRS
jgi:hypothetical protein